MVGEEGLEGACSCGRNHYIILAPPSFRETFSVVYDDRAEHDETHSTIRRIFTPRHAPHSKRHFCGFCGTSLTHWSEESNDDADWVYVNLGSLRNGSVEKLADEGLLASTDETKDSSTAAEKSLDRSTRSEGREIQGAPWYEEMIEGSELGRIKRKRGGRSSADGRSKVEWEVVEFTSESGDAGPSSGKRKIDQVGKGEDVEMRE
ncbi:MAG: hypothetical protein Q9170_006848 [Blastenia crenularia]